METSLERTVEQSHDIPSPWDRFWARSFDTILYLIPLLVVTPLLFIFNSYISSTVPLEIQKTLKVMELIIYWSSIFLAGGGWVLIEAALLCRYGTTPGKGLLGLEVLQADKSRPTYWQAVKRTLLVYSLGSCFGIPILNLQAYFASYVYYKFRGKVFWDRKILHQVQNFNLISSGPKKIIRFVAGFWILFSIAVMIIAFLVFTAIFYGYVILGRYNATENAMDKHCYETGNSKQFCEQRRKDMDKRWGLE